MADRVLRPSTRAASAPAVQQPAVRGKGGTSRGAPKARGGKGAARGGAPTQAPSSPLSVIEDNEDQDWMARESVRDSSPAAPFNVGEGTPPPRDSQSPPLALEHRGTASSPSTATPRASLEDINMPDDIVNAGIREENWRADFDHINANTPSAPPTTPHQEPTSQPEPSSPVVRHLRARQRAQQQALQADQEALQAEQPPAQQPAQQPASGTARGRAANRPASATRTRSTSAPRTRKHVRQATTPGTAAEKPAAKKRGRQPSKSKAASADASAPESMAVDLAGIEQTLVAPRQRRVSFHEDVRGGSSSISQSAAQLEPAKQPQADDEMITVTAEQLEQMVKEGINTRLLVQAAVTKPKPRKSKPQLFFTFFFLDRPLFPLPASAHRELSCHTQAFVPPLSSHTQAFVPTAFEPWAGIRAHRARLVPTVPDIAFAVTAPTSLEPAFELMPGTSQPARQKPPRVINLDGERVLEPDVLIAPSNVVSSLGKGWDTWFSLSDLSVENSRVSAGKKPEAQQNEVVFEGGRIYTREVTAPSKGDDDTLTIAQFLLLRPRLVHAIDMHFKPTELSAQLAGQVDLLFEAVIQRIDFTENFHRYREYVLAVLRHFVTGPTFDISVWQPKIFDAIVRRDIDRLLKSAASGSASSYTSTNTAHVLSSRGGRRGASAPTPGESRRRWGQRRQRRRRRQRQRQRRWRTTAGRARRLAAGGCKVHFLRRTERAQFVLLPRRRREVVHSRTPHAGGRRLLPTQGYAGNSTALQAARVSASSTTPAPSAAPGSLEQPLVTAPSSAPSTELLPIVTPLRADRWDFWIRRLGLEGEWADVPEGIRN
ncbi:hypothetical protein R3P38DRAFT_3217501 [Favolaschia claudopus]|uniref:Uncharacterized protein n=1 Tax=Favolaschia claudopus TaxID=2862362 RepID=A0AAW0A4B9_9AGAR